MTSTRSSRPRTQLVAEDILHARIQTMGVAEHVFDMSVHGRTVRWHLYDVGGARGQRHSWIPYFDDAYVSLPHICLSSLTSW